PERPGALMRFLDTMNPEWNISLFHYRNQGSDYGRVLVGIQVPPADKKAFKEFLSQIGYPYENESKNPAYKLFLSSGQAGARGASPARGRALQNSPTVNTDAPLSRKRFEPPSSGRPMMAAASTTLAPRRCNNLA